MELLPQSSVQGFFHEAVTSAMRNQGVDADELTEFYLVNLLADFARGSLDNEPLAVLLAEAMTMSPAARAQRLREIGDRSLYVSGFFGDSLERGLVNVDYYIRIGGTAYRQLADGLSPGRANVYRELSRKFPRFVDVLAEISEDAMHGTVSLVRLYERWVRTRSQRIERRLRARGILPPTGDLQ